MPVVLFTSGLMPRERLAYACHEEQTLFPRFPVGGGGGEGEEGLCQEPIPSAVFAQSLNCWLCKEHEVADFFSFVLL